MDSDFLRINKRTLKWFQSYWSYSFVLVVLNFLTIDFICLPLILVKFELHVCSNLLLLLVVLLVWVTHFLEVNLFLAHIWNNQLLLVFATLVQKLIHLWRNIILNYLLLLCNNTYFQYFLKETIPSSTHYLVHALTYYFCTNIPTSLNLLRASR